MIVVRIHMSAQTLMTIDAMPMRPPRSALFFAFVITCTRSTPPASAEVATTAGRDTSSGVSGLSADARSIERPPTSVSRPSEGAEKTGERSMLMPAG